MRDAADFMELAVAEACRGVRADDGGPFGAVIVRGHEVVGVAHNRVLLDQDPTAHAEMLAIRAACAHLHTHDLRGTVLYATCEPCPMCLGAVFWAQIDAVYYAHSREDAAAMGFGDASFHEQFGLPPEDRKLPMKQAFPELAAPLMQLWLDKANRRVY